MKVNDLVDKLNKLAADKDFHQLLSKAVTHDEFHRLVREHFTPYLQGLAMHTWGVITEHRKEIIRYDRQFIPHKNSRWHERGKFSNLTFHAVEGCGSVKFADLEEYFKRKEQEDRIANLKQSIKEQEETLHNLYSELDRIEKEKEK